MRALSAALAPLLASLLLIAAVVAPAHCLAGGPAAAPHADALCLPDAVAGLTEDAKSPGLQAALPHDGTTSPHDHQAGGVCLVCALQAAALPAPPLPQPAPQAGWQPVAHALPAARAPPGRATFQPQLPRAPPAA